jgi:ABC-2 type transport system permease protein/oleandomycin transport system permease protein
LLTQLRTPQALVFATIQPVIFVLLFRYAFGGAIHVPGPNYVDFLMPGIFAQTVAFGPVGTAVGLSGDLRTGILVRFRTPADGPDRGARRPDRRRPGLQPACRSRHDRRRLRRRIPQPARRGRPGRRDRPGGRVRIRDLLGLRVPGLRVSDPEAAQAAAVPVLFLLVFTSAAFVPATAIPGWLQAFGTHQPVDALVNAERALILGGPAAHNVLISLAWSGGLLAVFALLAVRTYARMGR